MKCNKALLAAALLVMSAASQAELIIFDGNFGGTAKLGTVETGIGNINHTGLGDEPYGDPLEFSTFDVSAGRSVNVNLAGHSFSIGNIDTSYRVYQDLFPDHGGLGAVSASDFSGDNLRPGNSDVKADEVLFFDFDDKVKLVSVFFNGGHTENTTVQSNMRGDTDYFNVFASNDGVNYVSLTNGQVVPTDQEYIDTGVASGFSHYAVAASGWSESNGGYVEAIKVTKVSSPSSIALLGLGVLGLVVLRRKKA